MRKLKLDELNRLSTEAFRQAPKHPVCLMLDNIRSLHNVGSAFRSADAFLAEKILLCGITGTPPNRELHKTALGAEDAVQWQYFKNSNEAILQLKQDHYKIISIEHTNQSLPLQNFVPQKENKYCFVFGNEVFGVSDEILLHSDMCLEIPQFGTKHSLNVSVAIGIVLWNYVAKLKYHS
ncbi:MAG: RNA methyltransferase [Cytophagaceae bacterium]|nr:RNA methyltransferase [Cytophagaceae bacterium]MDW8456810.1 RNA methyltransferase [Cytophagaceae bacterium]